VADLLESPDRTPQQRREEGRMSTKTRDFSTAAIASLSTGILLCKMGDVHEAAEYLMGHPIWTHQFADKKIWSEMQKKIAEQCPGMPTEIDGVNNDNYLEKLAEIEGLIGNMVRIRKGNGLTAALPTDGIPDHLKDKVILVNAPSNVDNGTEKNQ
jgi:hypothetical protein